MRRYGGAGGGCKSRDWEEETGVFEALTGRFGRLLDGLAGIVCVLGVGL